MEEGKGDDASVEDEAVDNSAAPIGNDTSVLGGAEGEEFDFVDRLGFLSVTAFHGSRTSDRRHWFEPTAVTTPGAGLLSGRRRDEA